MKIMSRFLNHKKLLDKLYLKWTKNTWRTSWELLMSKFNKDLWFNFKNAMFKVKKTVQFMDGEEMISHNQE